MAESQAEAAIAAVKVCLEDADSTPLVRKAAVDALLNIAEEGNASVIAALSARLEDEDKDVREAALNALPKIAVKGDAGAMEAVCASGGGRACEPAMEARQPAAVATGFVGGPH